MKKEQISSRIIQISDIKMIFGGAASRLPNGLRDCRPRRAQRQLLIRAAAHNIVHTFIVEAAKNKSTKRNAK